MRGAVSGREEEEEEEAEAKNKRAGRQCRRAAWRQIYAGPSSVDTERDISHNEATQAGVYLLSVRPHLLI